MQLAAPRDFREAYGVRIERIGGAVALRAVRSDNLALNRTLAHGFDEPLTEARVAQIVEGYARHGIQRFLLQWCPLAEPPDADCLLQASGFQPRTRMARMFRPAEAVPLPATSYELRQVVPAEREVFGTFLAAAHEGPAALAPGFSSTIGCPGWRHYFAVSDDRPVSGAALYTRGGVAWCGLAGTLPEARGRGAHGLLLAARIRDAAQAGCRWVVCDTMEDTATHPNPSFRNMRRAGFETAYLRTNYLFDRAAQSGQ